MVLLGQNGRPITEGFKRETGFPQSTVTLAPGKNAFVAFTYLDGRVCTTGTFRAYRVRIFLPASRRRVPAQPDAQDRWPDPPVRAVETHLPGDLEAGAITTRASYRRPAAFCHLTEPYRLPS